MRKRLDLIALEFFIQKKANDAGRSLPYLPRVGVYIDFAGLELVFKKTSFLEAIIEVAENNLHPSNLYRISRKHLAQIRFPQLRRTEVIDTSYRNV